MISNGQSVALSRVAFDDQQATERWLQELLHKNPGLLPIEDVSAAWGPLASLGREIPLSVGYIDNLFASPVGEVTVVEAKLWRNPESRREVIGQILDQAAALQLCPMKNSSRRSSHPGRRTAGRSGSG